MAQYTVLLVEDDEASRYSISRHLTAAGFKVIEAPDTLAALAVNDAGTVVDALVADIQMPKGAPHGLSLATMLRSRKRSLVVAFVTAYEDLATITRERWGADVVFGKPIDLAKLTETLKTRLAASSEPD